MKTKWKAQPKQEIALKRNEKEILYGGARGGGKTDAGLVWLLYNVHYKKFRALVIRKNFTDLSDWVDRATEMYSSVGGKKSNDYFEFPSGARIRFGHLADKEAYQKYQGHEYQNILIEEITHIPRESDYEKLRASCRSTLKEIPSQIFATTNPDGPGHDWVKERWNIPDIPDGVVEYIEEVSGLTRVFIPSTLDDNPILMEADPDYVKIIESIKDPELRRAWREGSWEGFGVEGAYYVDQMKKVYEEKRIVEGLYDPVLQVYTWCDLGIADSFSIGYFQVMNNQWRVIDYDEFEGEGLKDAINRMRDKGFNYAEHYAPHDIEVRELGTGVSRKETAQGFGVDYNVAPKLSIQDGIDALRLRFPTLWFDKDNCDGLIKKLKKYHKEFDEKRGVFKAKPAHDANSHAADMMRYWAVSKIYTVDRTQEDRILRNRYSNKTME